MRIVLTALSVICLVIGGCAGGTSNVSPMTMGLGDVHARDPLLDAQCRVPCNVSPGPGCC